MPYRGGVQQKVKSPGICSSNSFQDFQKFSEQLGIQPGDFGPARRLEKGEVPPKSENKEAKSENLINRCQLSYSGTTAGHNRAQDPDSPETAPSMPVRRHEFRAMTPTCSANKDEMNNFFPLRIFRKLTSNHEQHPFISRTPLHYSTAEVNENFTARTPHRDSP